MTLLLYKISHLPFSLILTNFTIIFVFMIVIILSFTGGQLFYEIRKKRISKVIKMKDRTIDMIGRVTSTIEKLGSTAGSNTNKSKPTTSKITMIDEEGKETEENHESVQERSERSERERLENEKQTEEAKNMLKSCNNDHKSAVELNKRSSKEKDDFIKSLTPEQRSQYKKISQSDEKLKDISINIMGGILDLMDPMIETEGKNLDLLISMKNSFENSGGNKNTKGIDGPTKDKHKEETDNENEKDDAEESDDDGLDNNNLNNVLSLIPIGGTYTI